MKLALPLLLSASVWLPIISHAGPLVNFNDTWRYRKGTSAPQSDWKTVADGSLDASWLSGLGFIGYGDGTPGTTLSDMRQVSGGSAGYRMVHLRKTFTATGLAATDELVLETDYDDAFIAFIDGVYVDDGGAPGAPAEPAWNTTATVGSHECSFGNSSPASVRTTVLGTVAATLTPGTHVLSVILLNQDLTSSDAVLKMSLRTQTPIPPPDLHWELADSPVTLTSTFNVTASQELIIDPGVEVRCHGGSAAITCAGKITALGTAAQPIRFVRANAGTAWQKIIISGNLESNFHYCDFDGANTSGTIQGAGTASVSPSINLEKCRWLNTDVQMVELTYSSCNIIDCEFDSIGAQELIHFSNMPSTGHALIKGCRFGAPGVAPTSGYNDIVDFTGGNRPGPIARFIDNIFLASVDDCFDMDATDAHIEGNLFLNVQQGAQRDSSSNPITTGEGSGVSELVICRNFFYNCEHLLLLKDSGAAVLENNTFLKMVENPLAKNAAGTAIPPGIILFGEPWRGRPYGGGAIYKGNIAWDLAPVIQTTPFPLFSVSGAFLDVKHSLIQGNVWLGTGNIAADPMFVSTTGIDYTTLRSKLMLQSGSPAIGTGPNGLDMGASVPAGASISGAPVGTTTSRSATINVSGPGIWVYKWRLNGGAYSADVPLVSATVLNGGIFTSTMYDNPTPVTLTNLADGTYTLDVLGRNSAGDWQPIPVSTTWTVSNPPPDFDGDLLPDAWETANGLNPSDDSDAAKDADGDASSNLHEFIAGTDPQSRTSVLSAIPATLGNGTVRLSISVVAGKTYRVEMSENLQGTPWDVLATLPAQAATETITVDDPNATTATRKFYRVITPAN